MIYIMFKKLFCFWKLLKIDLRRYISYKMKFGKYLKWVYTTRSFKNNNCTSYIFCSRFTDFLDIYLDLENDKFCPYRKPNDTPLYVHCESNHPLNI